MHAEFKNKSDTSNNVDNSIYFKIIDKIRKQHAWKTLGTKENSYSGHCAVLRKAETSDYKTFIMGNSIIRTIHCDHRTAALFQVYNCKNRV